MRWPWVSRREYEAVCRERTMYREQRDIWIAAAEKLHQMAQEAQDECPLASRCPRG